MRTAKWKYTPAISKENPTNRMVVEIRWICFLENIKIWFCLTKTRFPGFRLFKPRQFVL
jgi:hypothetical protein